MLKKLLLFFRTLFLRLPTKSNVVVNPLNEEIAELQSTNAEVKEVDFFSKSNDLRDVHFDSPKVYGIGEKIAQDEKDSDAILEGGRYSTGFRVVTSADEDEYIDDFPKDIYNPWEAHRNKTYELTKEDFKKI